MGRLYVIATPIGNLEDISQRAIHCLNEVDLIAAEDTRHSAVLLNAHGIKTRTTAFHDHNEQDKLPELIDFLQQGHSIALISDAGTPLVSDPGYHLVSAAHDAGVDVVPVPGPCAAIAALSASGLPSDQFLFAGFIPAKAQARLKFLKAYRDTGQTLIFYETPHRIVASLQAMVQVFGGERPATLARELTKKFETIRKASLQSLLEFVEGDSQQQKGEIVLLLAGREPLQGPTVTAEARAILEALLQELSPSQASSLTAQITGLKKGLLYDEAMALRRQPNE